MGCFQFPPAPRTDPVPQIPLGESWIVRSADNPESIGETTVLLTFLAQE